MRCGFRTVVDAGRVGLLGGRSRLRERQGVGYIRRSRVLEFLLAGRQAGLVHFSFHLWLSGGSGMSIAKRVRDSLL